MHRQQCVPFTLQSHRGDPGGVLPAGHQQTVHRRPDRLHRGRDPVERHGHVLLDLFDIYDSEQDGGQGGPRHGGVWGCKSRGRQRRSQVPQVLSVGVLRPLLPGHALLRAALSVEDVGGRPHQDAGPRPQLSHRQRRMQSRPKETLNRILHLESAPAEFLRV